MSESKTKSDKCQFCNSKFSDEIIKKLKENKSDVYCENCGDLIQRVDYRSFHIPNQNKDILSNIPFTSNELPQEITVSTEVFRFPNGRIYYDRDFSQVFKRNFIVVFSRIIYFQILRLDKAGIINKEKLEINEDLINELHRRISPLHENRIKGDFMNNLHEITLDEFELNFKKLQGKFQSNREYREDFIVFSRWLINRVLTIIQKKTEQNKLTNFEKAILNELNKLKSTESYKQNFIENKQHTQLEKPRDLLLHYFKKYGRCCYNRKLTKPRHNYILQDKHTLVCPDCKKILKLANYTESIISMSNRDLKKLEKEKGFGDITIYKAYFTRTLARGKKEWLNFPGIGYVGQTIEIARDRTFFGHIKNAFNPKKKDTYFGNSIKKNFIIKQAAWKFIRVMILQIIRFQGDINAIRNIEKPLLKKKELEDAINSTQQIADNAEKFWIGYYKAQYKEFGRNIEEGGKENRMLLLNPVKLDEAIRKIMHVRRNKGPFEKVRKDLKTTRAILVNNLFYYYGKSLKDIKHDMLLKETKRLFELGFLAKDIAVKLKLEGELENASKTVSDWIRNEIYVERFPEKPNYRRIRDIVLSEIIEQKVKEGHVSLKSLIQVLPGFEVPGETIREKTWELKRFIINNLGGIKKLNDKYHYIPKKDYLQDAIRIIRDHYKYKKKISAIKLALELGFCEDFGYTEDSLRKNAASRYIPQYTGKTMKELLEIALSS